MFSFFKKEKKPTETPAVVLTAEESQEAEALIATLESQLQAETDIDEQAKLYEALGLAQAKLSRTEEAIDALEKSLQAKKSIGDGYKKLMSLYNTQRAAAAQNSDDAKIDYYMDKMEEMRQIAKQLTISGN